MLAALDTYGISALNGLAIGLVLYTMAVGVSLVFGMMNILNLAQGILYMLGTYTAVRIVDPGGSWSSYATAVAAAIAAGMLSGGVLAALMRPLATRGHLDQALLTLGVAFIGTAALPSLFGQGIYSLAPPHRLGGSVSVAGNEYPAYRIAVIVVGLAIAAGVTLLVERTALGALVRAAVVDRPMLQALGVDTRKLTAIVFVLGASLASLGGVIGGPILGAAPGLDFDVLILAMAVVVVGGLGSAWGALVGAIVVGEVDTMGTALAPQFGAFFLFGTMAAILAIRPAGLFGDQHALST